MEEDTEACSPSFESDCSVRGSALALSAHLCLSKSEKAEKAEAKSESERGARGQLSTMELTEEDKKAQEPRFTVRSVAHASDEGDFSLFILF